MMKNAVGITIACEEYGASFFANGATPGGVLEHPGVLKDPGKVRDSWNAVYQGSQNAHKVVVLEEGMKYQQVGLPPEDSQFSKLGSSSWMRLPDFTASHPTWSVTSTSRASPTLSSSLWSS